MRHYSKIIFLCTGNTYLSPIAEAMYLQYTQREQEKGEVGESSLPACCSRGLVVLFSEPISPKVNVALSHHDMMPSAHENSMQLEQSEITQDTLLLTMTFSEKVTCLEKYQHGDVYTLGEFVGDDTDILDPYGGEEELYETCYNEIARRVRQVIQILQEEGGQAE